MLEPDAQRIMVIGCPGAGKSWLARKMAERLDLPWVCLDSHFWKAGWTTSDPAEWRGRVAELAARPAWIMDGNYSSTMDLRMVRADALVWLDFPRALCMRRVILRTLRDYGRPRPEMPGCPERLDRVFLRYVWRFPELERPKLETAMADSRAHSRLLRLVDPAEVGPFLSRLGRH